MSDANPLILPHHTNYCFFANIIIIGDNRSFIGDIIGDNRSFIGDICTLIGAIIGAKFKFIGATFRSIHYNSGRFIGAIGAIFYDISILNNNFECGIVAEKELCRITFVFFE